MKRTDTNQNSNSPTGLYRIIFKDGWMGGKFYINGELFKTISQRPKASLIIDGISYPAEYQIRRGSDDDMGHTYSWTITDIGILDGVIQKRFLSIRKLEKKEVFIEFAPAENA